MFPILLKLGPLTLHTYGLMVALGFLSAYFLARQRFERVGLPLAIFDQFVFVVMLSGLLGARLFYFLSLGFSELRSDPFAFFRIWEGGLMYYGGFITGLSAIFFLAWKKELSILALGDAFAAPLLLGQSLGRLGCFFAGCCYGRPTTSVLGVTFNNPDALAPLGISLQPAQLYASFGDLVLFGIVLWLERTARPRGFLMAFYLIGYGTLRFLMEFVRGDDRGPVFQSLAPSQWISIAAFLVGLQLLIYVQNKKRT